MKSFALNYGMTSNGMNRLLHDYGIQYKTGEQWFLYSQYVGKGYVGSVPVPITHSDGSKVTSITQSGLSRASYSCTSS